MIVIADGPWTAVLHCAGWTQVGESMRMPMRYLLENAANGIRLIDSCVRNGVNRLVFSSTAALFNANDDRPITEDAPIDPQSPYGDGKWMVERALHWAFVTHGLRSARLRYFNAAGADPRGRLGARPSCRRSDQAARLARHLGDAWQDHRDRRLFEAGAGGIRRAHPDRALP